VHAPERGGNKQAEQGDARSEDGHGDKLGESIARLLRDSPVAGHKGLAPGWGYALDEGEFSRDLIERRGQ
jgi:hypothetical protein